MVRQEGEGIREGYEEGNSHQAARSRENKRQRKEAWRCLVVLRRVSNGRGSVVTVTVKASEDESWD